MFKRVIEILIVPIMLMNVGGGIFGGVWLAFLGEWRLILIGLLVLVASNWLLSFLLMLAMPIAGLTVYFYERKNPLRHVFGFLSQLYTNILIVGTCFFAFSICSSYYSGNIDVRYIPYLLWSWGMALSPWQFFASKEQDNEHTMLTLFCASACYLFFLVSIFFGPILTLITILLFGILQLIVIPVFNMYVANKTMSYYDEHNVR